MVSSSRLKELWKDPAYRANQMAHRRRRYAEGTQARKELVQRLEDIRNSHLSEVRKFKQAASNKHRGKDIRGGYVPLPYKELYTMFRKAVSPRSAYRIIKLLRQIVEARHG